jgi:hypothetical protein
LEVGEIWELVSLPELIGGRQSIQAMVKKSALCAFASSRWMAAPFSGAMNSKRKLGRKNGVEICGRCRVDRALTLHALRETPRRQDAKTQRRKAAEGARVGEVWRVICSDPQYSGDEIQPL